MRIVLAVFVLALLTAGCDHEERIKALEKQQKELSESIKKASVTSDYELQARCSKDAKVWFNENWGRDKDTTLLDLTNHYNKKQNKCLGFVEHHYTLSSPSWMNHIAVFDIYENVRYADFSETHTISHKPTFSRDSVLKCEVWGKECKTLEEFNSLMEPLMND